MIGITVIYVNMLIIKKNANARKEAIMPNWCFNEMEVWKDDTTIAEDEFKVFKSVHNLDKGDNLDFEICHPMPETMKITSGTSTEDAMMLLKAYNEDYKEIDERMEWPRYKDTIKGKRTLKTKRKAIMKELENKLDKKDMEEGQMALMNIEKHGFQSWYEWSIANWGTKWNACAVVIHNCDDDFVSIYFETAWSPPDGWYRMLFKKFPNLCFKVKITEESDAYMGYIVGNKGHYSEEFATNPL